MDCLYLPSHHQSSIINISIIKKGVYKKKKARIINNKVDFLFKYFFYIVVTIKYKIIDYTTKDHILNYIYTYYIYSIENNNVLTNLKVHLLLFKNATSTWFGHLRMDEYYWMKNETCT